MTCMCALQTGPQIGCECPSTAKSSFIFVTSWMQATVQPLCYNSPGALERGTEGTGFYVTEATGQSLSSTLQSVPRWGSQVFEGLKYTLADSCEILCQGYHPGNILRLFLKTRGGKYLSKPADIISCCLGTSPVFSPHKNLAVLSLTQCNLRLCVTPELVNRRWWCLCLCTAFQSNRYVTYQSRRSWLWYSTDTPVISFQRLCGQGAHSFSLPQEKIPHSQHCTAHSHISRWPLNREDALVKFGSDSSKLRCISPCVVMTGWVALGDECYRWHRETNVEFKLD